MLFHVLFSSCKAQKHKELCCLVQVHPSTKTGAREVNAMGGEFAKRVYDKSKFKKKEDFLYDL